MSEAVTLAEDYLREHCRGAAARPRRAAVAGACSRADFGPAVRGALTSSVGAKPGSSRGAPAARCSRSSSATISTGNLAQAGCCHAGPRPPHPGPPARAFDAGATAEPAALRGRIDAALRGYADLYHDAFRRFTSARGVTRAPLDPWPRVLLFPGIGVLTVGRTRADAEIVADVYEHDAAVIQTATALGSYRPAEEIDLFDVEHSALGARPSCSGAPTGPRAPSPRALSSAASSSSPAPPPASAWA